MSADRTEYNRRYRQDHLEELRAYDRARYAERAEEKRAYATQYRQNTLGLNKRLREQQRVRRAERKAAVFAHYGKECACCGTTEKLSIDHINGGGSEHRKSLFNSADLSGAHFYTWLVKNNFPEGYQTLCVPCNSSKSHFGACRLDHSVEV